jgi:hypothetical protein
MEESDVMKITFRELRRYGNKRLAYSWMGVLRAHGIEARVDSSLDPNLTISENAARPKYALVVDAAKFEQAAAEVPTNV